MNGTRRIVRALALFVLSTGVMNCADAKVIRIFNGVPVEGRFIPYEAYGAYGRGADAEAHGDLPAAVRAYTEAASLDPKSPEVLTRLGAVQCAHPGTQDAARQAFARAEKLEPTYEPLFRERARCAFAKGDFNAALAFASRAVELDPDRDEAVVLHASLLEQRGKVIDATRLLDAHVIRHPRSVPAWLARYELANRQHDTVTMTRSARTLERLEPRLADRFTHEVPSFAPLARVDDAIRQGDIDEARSAARRAHLPPAELAVRAAVIGATGLARTQAKHVLDADPASAAARVALAAASDVMGDSNTVALALDLPLGERLTPLSPLARLLFADVLARHTDRNAARAFIGSLDAATTGNADPLFESLRLHVLTRIEETSAPKREGS